MHPILSLRFTLPIFAFLALCACGNPPPLTSYLNRGGPESLLDVSSEVVNLSTNSANDRAQLADWVAKDQPTRAELNCQAGGKSCSEAEKILELSGVPIVTGHGNENSVTLIYERILARDCDQRYVDNRDNFYNSNHKSFGCATAANMVQQVTDKQEFVSPALSDDPSAVRAVNDIARAYRPRPVVNAYSVGDSQIATAKTSN